MINVRGLTKRFGPILAVDRIDLHVEPADIYGFLGANGSGKTTTVRMLLGLVLPTAGTVELFGEKMPAAAGSVLRRVGALVEEPAAYRHLSGRRHLALIDAMARGAERASRARRIDDVLDQVGLGGVGSRPVKAYSLGMRQRLGLAGALLRSPELLILDEPTNGLDPQGIREIRELLVGLHGGGTTIFLSSHLLAEVEQLCTRVGVLDRGHVVLQENLADLRLPSGLVTVHTPDIALARGTLDGQVTGYDETSLLVKSDDPATLNARLVSAGVRVTELSPHRRSLEDVVLEVTGPGSDRIESR